MVRREAGQDGRKLVKALAMIALGKPAEIEKAFGEGAKVRPYDRLLAIETLLAYGFGRPAQPVEVSPDLLGEQAREALGRTLQVLADRAEAMEAR